MLKILAYSLAYLASIFIIYFLIVGICLTFRFLRVTFGGKVKPDCKKAILVTGATSGIGLLVSKYFFKLGFTVIGGYFNNQEPGYAELLELVLKSSPPSCATISTAVETNSVKVGPKKTPNVARLFLVEMDVRSTESIEKASQEICSILDQHNIELYSLINNAGIARDGFFPWASCESLRDVVDTNLTGLFTVTRHFMYRIIKSGGRVVNVSSGLHLFPASSVSVYGATKSAIAHFSDALNADLDFYGASCRCVMPGNFIAASNILFPRLRAFQECISKLTPEEKELYRELVEYYTQLMDNLVRKRFSLNDKLDPIQVSSIYKVHLPDDVMCGQAKKITKLSAPLIERAIGWVLHKFDGGANAQSLENSGLIGGFDDAVRLRSCPRRLYAGDRIYSNFSGPGLEYLPLVIIDFMRKLIEMSLKNK